MKKNIKYIIFWLVIISLLILIQKYVPLFAENSGNLFTKDLHLAIINIDLAVIATAILFILTERKKLIPYLSKFLKFRSLLFQLVRRDFKAKYKRSVLGVLWTVLNPLFTMLVLTIVFSAIFRFEIKNFPVYLLSGQIIFTFFSEATNMAMSSILEGASMFKKVNMPKYIFPLSKILSSLVNLMLSLIALIFVMLMTNSPFHWTMLLMPIPIIYILIFSTGVGLILSAMVVFFRDANYLYGIFLTGLTYFTPLFYPISIIPDRFRIIISLNPLYHFVEYFRTVAIYGGIPTLWQNVVCGTLSMVSIAIGLFVFYKKQDRFILYV